MTLISKHGKITIITFRYLDKQHNRPVRMKQSTSAHFLFEALWSRNMFSYSYILGLYIWVSIYISRGT